MSSINQTGVNLLLKPPHHFNHRDEHQILGTSKTSPQKTVTFHPHWINPNWALNGEILLFNQPRCQLTSTNIRPKNRCLGDDPFGMAFWQVPMLVVDFRERIPSCKPKFEGSYNTPLEHTPTNPPREL